MSIIDKMMRMAGRDPQGNAKAISVNENGFLNTKITDALPAGSNVIGKISIDQTTPGVTNAVQLTDSIVEESAARNRGLYPTSKVELLDLPQIDGMDTSGGVHPSVLWFRKQWKGWHYWMAYTPYPGIHNEWPCILVSNDGVNWQEPEGINNPIDRDPSSDYFPDPELVYMESQDKLRCYYLTEHSLLSFKESSDGVNWDAQRTNCSIAKFGVSPSIVKKASNNWEMWIGADDKLAYYISEDGVNWSLVGKTTSNLDGVGYIWHHEVRYTQSGYHLLASIGKIETAHPGNNNDLHYGFSIDGIHWYIDPVPLLSREKDLYDRRVYRASLVPFGDEWLIYTSGNTASANPTERIGLMKGKLNLSVDLYKFLEPPKDIIRRDVLIPLQKLKAPVGNLGGLYTTSAFTKLPPEGAYSAKIVIIVRSWQGVPRGDGRYGIETLQTGIENIRSARTFVSVEGFTLSGGTAVPSIMEINFHPMSPEEDDINDNLFIDNIYAKLPFIFNGDGESERVRLRIKQLGIYLRQGDWRIDVGETPKPGDLVTVTVNGTGHVFTCVATNPGENEYTNAEELKELINALTDVAASQYDNVISIGSVETVSVSISAEEESSMKEPVEITEDEGVELEAHVLWFYK